jgi:hypothetical protein
MDNWILVVSLDSLVSDHDLYGLITIPSNKSDAVIISIKILGLKNPGPKAASGAERLSLQQIQNNIIFCNPARPLPRRTLLGNMENKYYIFSGQFYT